MKKCLKMIVLVRNDLKLSNQKIFSQKTILRITSVDSDLVVRHYSSVRSLQTILFEWMEIHIQVTHTLFLYHVLNLVTFWTLILSGKGPIEELQWQNSVRRYSCGKVEITLIKIYLKYIFLHCSVTGVPL